MTITQQVFLILSGLLGFLAVAGGAFGAHYLKYRLAPESLTIFEVAIRYQLYHVLALIGVVALMSFSPSIWFNLSGWFFIIGTIIFSGSLYALIISGIKTWGPVTPIGGIILLLGWLSIMLGGIFIRY